MFLGEDGAAGSEGRGAGSQGVAGMEGGERWQQGRGEQEGTGGDGGGRCGGTQRLELGAASQTRFPLLVSAPGFWQTPFFSGRSSERKLQRLVLL